MRLGLRRFGTLGGTVTPTFTNGLTVPSGGQVVIGTTSPITTAALHVVQPSTGAIVVTNLETDSTTKVGRFAVPHYTNSEESLLVVGGAVTSTGGNIDFGGGSGVLNTATQITFYTAANNTTLTGTVRMRINATGYVAVGTHTPTAFMHLSASSTAAASLCLPHGTAPTSPVNGDIWTTTAGLYVRINGATVGPLS